ncbi:MAG: MBL fold metallo-hydrolase [Chitinophagales bacterium]|jgi:phosphoribosyl 1,2-cyclic phosphate phosphodiesterase|nr:MBL fold metallo-hydrolase [Chitinophagales bacterium]
MKITFLGTGTSVGVPMIACHCAVCQSNDPRDHRLRTSVLVEIDNFCCIIDTGPDFRQQMLRQKVQQLNAILYTHHHQDHIIGLDDVRPFNIWSTQPMPIYATEHTQQHLKRTFSYAFGDNPYPGSPTLHLHTIDDEQIFFLQPHIKVVPIPIVHGNLNMIGFRINNFTYITDASYISPESIAKIRGSEILVLNALRHELHWSHFNLEQAVAIAQKIGANHTYFTHISHQLGKYADISKQLPPNIFLAHDSLTVEC